MSGHTKEEVNAALIHLLAGSQANPGGPLTYEEYFWETHNGLNFGECLWVALQNLNQFPQVMSAPFFVRASVPTQNTIGGNVYAVGVNSYTTIDPPISFLFAGYFTSGFLLG